MSDYRTNEESHRIASAINELLLKYPRRTVGSLLKEIVDNSNGDGKVMRHLNRMLRD